MFIFFFVRVRHANELSTSKTWNLKYLIPCFSPWLLWIFISYITLYCMWELFYLPKYMIYVQSVSAHPCQKKCIHVLNFPNSRTTWSKTHPLAAYWTPKKISHYWACVSLFHSKMSVLAHLLCKSTWLVHPLKARSTYVKNFRFGGVWMLHRFKWRMQSSSTGPV